MQCQERLIQCQFQGNKGLWCCLRAACIVSTMNLQQNQWLPFPCAFMKSKFTNLYPFTIYQSRLLTVLRVKSLLKTLLEKKKCE